MGSSMPVLLPRLLLLLLLPLVEVQGAGVRRLARRRKVTKASDLVSLARGNTLARTPGLLRRKIKVRPARLL